MHVYQIETGLSIWRKTSEGGAHLDCGCYAYMWSIYVPPPIILSTVFSPTFLLVSVVVSTVFVSLSISDIEDASLSDPDHLVNVHQEEEEQDTCSITHGNDESNNNFM